MRISAMPTAPSTDLGQVLLLLFDVHYQDVGATRLLYRHDLDVGAGGGGLGQTLFGQYLLDEIVDGVGGNSNGNTAQHGNDSKQQGVIAGAGGWCEACLGCATGFGF